MTASSRYPVFAITLLAFGLSTWMTVSAGERVEPVLFLEAEGFAERGGWVVDTQAMDVMGSPFVLAHGLGRPVEDAVTEIEVPKAGAYRVWVRTRDWVAPWNVPGSPGRFQVLFNGRALGATFGTEGADWHWQQGGTVELPVGKVTVALHDLTGFDGRCDAVVLTADTDLQPPNEEPALSELRRRLLGLIKGTRLGEPSYGGPGSESQATGLGSESQGTGDPARRARLPGPEDVGDFDVVVVGGGMAGCCTAVSAARFGCKVALIQDRPVLGGNNSSEVRVGLSGLIHQEPYPRLGDLVDEIGPIGHWNLWEAKREPESPRSKRILEVIEAHPEKKTHNAGPASNYEDDRKRRIVEAEDNATLFLNTHAYRVEKEGGRIAAVIAKDTLTGRELRFRGRLFADCTGDGNLGFLAGADYRIGREAKSETGEERAPEEADRMVMGTSVQWYTEEMPGPSAFPDCPWAVQFNEETCQRLTRGDWDWETGMSLDQVTEIEKIRDYALRVTYGNWAYLKNSSDMKDKIANRRLAWVAYIGGKRESRRLLGDVILQAQDVTGQRPFADACVTTTWTIDLHYPHPENTKHFPGEEFRSVARHTKIKPYPIPYRCLYSRNVENLMMAGRNISVTHVALGTIRVQRTTGMMGEVLGMAASLCVQHETTPRGVYEKYLDELKAMMRQGVGRGLLVE